MIAYKKEATVNDHGRLVLDDLPFGVGTDVEVVVLERREGRPSVDGETAGDEDRYPLRGSVLRYDDPTEPVAVEDWEALQ
jgi:hypothetical protein